MRAGRLTGLFAVIAVLMLGDAVAQEVSGTIPDSDSSGVQGMQSSLPTRQDTLHVLGNGPFLIRPFMDAESVRIWINGDPTDHFELDAREGLIRLGGIAPDSNIVLVAAYRHLPLTLQPAYRLWTDHQEVSFDEAASAERLPGESNPGVLTTRGRITRGVLTGNNRDARIESGLQLEVEGEVAPGVMLQANLSDEDTPLVPEGVTRQFDQFDRIQIGLSSRRGEVRLGDFNAALEGTRYGLLQRKLQGASVSVAPIRTGSQSVHSIRAAAGAAISRGQFHTTDVAILEGVQGPYRLTGAAGERFILVLPGTERVYLDGVLLERGMNMDYIIDYQLGEITFTSRHVMGRERRVRVDYEYTTNRYTRTMTFSEATLGLGGSFNKPWATVTFGGIREADGDAFLDESGLSAADSMLVASSVDGNVQVDGALVVPYDAEALYTQYVRDVSTSGEAIWMELTRAPEEGESVYRVPFTFMGAGRGSYVRVPSQGGGIAYRWAGEGAGAYEAVRTLPVPSRKSLGEVRLRVLGIPGLRIESGVAASSLDRNRLSLDRSSVRTGTASDLTLSTEPLHLGMGMSFSVRSTGYVRTADFETFERVRGVEFARDWALPLLDRSPFGAVLDGADERLGDVSMTLRHGDDSSLQAGLGRLSLGSNVKSTRRHADADIELFERARLELSFRETRASGNLSGPFASEHRSGRGRLSAANAPGGWSPWLEYEEDRWVQKGLGALAAAGGTDRTDRLPYRSASAGLDRSWQTHVVSVSGTFRQEDDLHIDGTTFVGGSRIRIVQAAWDWIPSTRIRSRSTIGWRRSSPTGPSEPSSDAQNALLVGLDGQVRSGSAGTIGWMYSVRSEQTAAMQEVFIRTGPDRGSFVWQDINGDGRIQLDEFFPETTPGEGEYARTLFPSDSLESATTAEARLSYNWLPTPSSSGWRRASLNTSIDVRETTKTEDRVGVYLLRPSALRQPGQTVNGRIRMSGTLGFYPLRRDRDADVSVIRVSSLSKLANGSESMEQTRIDVGLREEVFDRLDLTLESGWSEETSRSVQFATRSFDIRRWEIRPGSIVRVKAWRVQSEWMVGRGEEDGTGASVRTMRIPLTVFWNRNQMRWRTGGEWSESAIEGGTPQGLQLFELTEGRGAGTSWMWHVHLDVQLTEIVSATLRYDGRRPTGLPVIHTGRFQLSARF